MSHFKIRSPLRTQSLSLCPVLGFQYYAHSPLAFSQANLFLKQISIITYILHLTVYMLNNSDPQVESSCKSVNQHSNPVIILIWTLRFQILPPYTSVFWWPKLISLAYMDRQHKMLDFIWLRPAGMAPKNQFPWYFMEDYLIWHK